MRRIVVFSLIGFGVLSGCFAEKEPKLMNIRDKSTTSNEYEFIPNKPLKTNIDTAILPAPGGQNLADPDPKADAIAALGGDLSKSQTARPAEQPLVQYAKRFGYSENIRTFLATKDREFRKKNRGLFLERLLNVNVYFRAYEEETLDPRETMQAFLKAGVKVSATPPPAQKQNSP